MLADLPIAGGAAENFPVLEFAKYLAHSCATRVQILGQHIFRENFALDFKRGKIIHCTVKRLFENCFIPHNAFQSSEQIAVVLYNIFLTIKNKLILNPILCFLSTRKAIFARLLTILSLRESARAIIGRRIRRIKFAHGADGSNMTAVVCDEPGKLSLRTTQRPLRPDGEVLLRIRRIGICGTDYHIFAGLHPFLEYPRVMGHELSAIVDAADSASKFKVGQLVVVNPYLACGVCHACKNAKPNCCMKIQVLGVHRDGGMGEWLCLPEKNIIPADGLSADAAASVEFLAIGAHAVRRSGMKSGASALVIGAGPIGLGAALFAQIAGGEVTVMDRDLARLELASAATGISRTILADATAPENVFQSTQGNGFDAVFDATGNRASMESSFGHVAHGGSYVMVGLVKENITFFDPDFHKREMTLMASRNATAQDFEQVISAVKSGYIPISKLITHRTSLAEAITMLPFWAHEKNGLIKAIIEIE